MAKFGLLIVLMLRVAFKRVQTVCLAQFVRRKPCISYTNNGVKDGDCDCTSSAMQCCTEPPSAIQILGKVFSKHKTVNLMGCQASIKSLTSANANAVWMYSTNRQLSMKDQSSQPTTCKDTASPSTVEESRAIVDMWSVTLGALGAALAAIILANTDVFLTKPVSATSKYLENADLRTTEGSEKVFKAKTLWKTSGAVIMAVRRPG